MNFFRKIVTFALILSIVVVSGCMDESITEDGNASDDLAGPGNEQEISVADMALSEDMVGITDSEMQELEAQIEELEALINEMSLEEEIVPEEI
ncbi:MAG: hypothetical protein QCH31_05560 [Methanolobus sp.]|nr:hypothetical protein [Methanolobus sp.]